jgi:hypothetical protein
MNSYLQELNNDRPDGRTSNQSFDGLSYIILAMTGVLLFLMFVPGLSLYLPNRMEKNDAIFHHSARFAPSRRAAA